MILYKETGRMSYVHISCQVIFTEAVEEVYQFCNLNYFIDRNRYISMQTNTPFMFDYKTDLTDVCYGIYH